MPNESPDLIAYLDEAGCAGNQYGQGSSNFLVIGAVVMAAADEDGVLSIFAEAREELKTEKRFKKFSKAGERDNFVLTRLLATKKVRLVQVALHKPSMEGRYTREHHKEEYQYLVKMAIERISWIARDAAKKHGVDGYNCQLVFSEQKLYSYEDLCAYMHKLSKGQGRYNCSASWDHIHGEILISRHEDETGMHLADISASALYKAIEPNQLGMTDDRFERNMLKIVAKFGGKPYGLKLFPPREIEEMKGNGHFEFLKLMP